MNKYNKYLITIFYLSLTIFNSNASEINLEFERSTIKEHCIAVFENFEHKFLENNWEILKSNNSNKPIIAKIEKPEAVNDFGSITSFLL